MMGDMMGYDNPILDFSDRYPVGGFFVVPVLMQLVASGLFYLIRSVRAGSPIQGTGVGAGEETVADPLTTLGNVRKQGGDDLDLVFRATSNPRATAPGTGLWDTVMPSPTSQPVRYDGGYHDEIWLSDPNYVDHGRITDQTQSGNADVSVFNGLNGLNKLR
jgi:hypothetical protein